MTLFAKIYTRHLSYCIFRKGKSSTIVIPSSETEGDSPSLTEGTHDVGNENKLLAFFADSTKNIGGAILMCDVIDN